jgi:hypothetical protein
VDLLHPFHYLIEPMDNRSHSNALLTQVPLETCRNFYFHNLGMLKILLRQLDAQLIALVVLASIHALGFDVA